MAFFQRLAGLAVLASATLLTGCGAFFSCEGKTDCPVTTTPTATVDFAYVSNSTSGTEFVAGYDLTNGTLSAISGASLNLGFVPIAMSVAHANNFLYVASRADAASPGVYVYSISSTGALTKANSGNALFTDDTISSMDISPDGSYLVTVGTSGITGVILSEYQLNTTTGLITAGPTTFATPGTSCDIVTGASPVSQQCTVRFSSSGEYVGVALGGYGFEIFPYSSSGGITNTPQLSPSPSTTSADFSLAFDSANNLYVASTDALTPFTGIGGTSAPVQGTAQTFATQVTPRSVTTSIGFDSLYTANEGNGSISSFSLPGSGTLTLLGSAIEGPANVSALGAESTGKYLLAAGYGTSNGVQLFNITSTGTLTAVSSVAGTGTDLTVPTLVAISH